MLASMIKKILKASLLLYLPCCMAEKISLFQKPTILSADKIAAINLPQLIFWLSVITIATTAIIMLIKSTLLNQKKHRAKYALIWAIIPVILLIFMLIPMLITIVKT